MASSPRWRSSNRLLDRLPADVRARLQPHLQRIELPVGKVLYASDLRNSHIYFPCSGVVSLLYVMEDGTTGEIAMVGNEGVVGVSVLVDSTSTPTRGEVQIAGEGYVLKDDVVQREFQRGGAFHLMILRYTQLMLSQMAQAVICNRHHALERQFSTWLLLAFDRVPGEECGSPRKRSPTCWGCAAKASRRSRGACRARARCAPAAGRIRLLDRDALAGRSCECYSILHREYERLLGTVAD